MTGLHYSRKTYHMCIINSEHSIGYNIGLMDFMLVLLLQTSMPQGTYCDVISGNLVSGCCTGKTVTVDRDSKATVQISPSTDEDGIMAIHTGVSSLLLVRFCYIYNSLTTNNRLYKLVKSKIQYEARSCSLVNNTL